MDFDINNAMNTFNQQLGQRVASGQMTLDQARAAQAEMTALQRMPSATREQATDVAQRQMQVGQYAPMQVTPPMPQGGLTLSNVPQPPTDMQEVIGSRMPPPGVRSGDTRIFADQPMALPGGTGYDERGNMLRAPQPRGLADIFRRRLMMPSQPPRVDNSTFVSMPNFRMPTAPQPLPSNAQAMAMGGLMRKYGGMC